MKILFLTHWYPSEKKPSNGVFIKNHLNAINASGHKTTLIHFEIGKVSGKLFEFRTEKIEGGYRVVIDSVLWKFVYNLYGLQFYLLNQGLKKTGLNLSEFDLIHANVSHPNGVFANYLSKKTGIPFIITEHHTQLPRLARHALFGARIRKALRNASKVLPVSQKLKEAIDQIEPKSSLKIVPNVVLGDFHYDTSVEANRNKLHFISVVGWKDSSRSTKRPHLLIKALAQFSRELNQEVTLTHVGVCEIKEELIKLCKKSNFRIDFVGVKTPLEINVLFQKARYLVHATSFETFCLVVPEAQKAGLPCICSNIDPIPSVADDYGIIFTENTVEDWVKALHKSVHLDIDRLKLSERMKTKYTWEEVGAMISNVYQEAVLQK